MSKRDDIEWGAGRITGSNDDEVRFYEDGFVPRYPPAWQDDDDLPILHGKEALRRILADVEIVHEEVG